MNNGNGDEGAPPDGQQPQPPPPDVAPPDLPPPNLGVAMVPLVNYITVPNLRNGALQDITSAAPREYIPRSFRWTVIADLPSAEHPGYVETICRAQFVTLCERNYAGLDEPARALLRKKAIVVGSIRAAVAAAYQLTAADMQESECCGAIKTAGGVQGARTLVDTAATADGDRVAWEGWTPATAAEHTVMNAMMYMGIGIPALQGFCLVRFGHHFLSNAGDPPLKPWLALIKQVRATVVDAVHVWMDYEWFRDTAFHKACHPILPAMKQAWAKDPDTKARLNAANLGSAAVRLPATPPDFEQAKAAIAILHEATPSLQQMTYTVNTTQLDAATAAVAAAEAGDAERRAVATAVHLVEVHAPRIAYAAGIVAKIHESGLPSTLLGAFSIKRLLREHPEAYDAGFRAKAALNIRVSERLQRGEFAGEVWEM